MHELLDIVVTMFMVSVTLLATVGVLGITWLFVVGIAVANAKAQGELHGYRERPRRTS